MNVYSRQPKTWTEGDLSPAQLLADVAASYVANASELQRSERVREQLQRALESRIIIEQAKGILAARNNTSVEAAYDKLRRYTRDHNTGLHYVAEAVVHHGLNIT